MGSKSAACASKLRRQRVVGDHPGREPPGSTVPHIRGFHHQISRYFPLESYAPLELASWASRVRIDGGITGRCAYGARGRKLSRIEVGPSCRLIRYAIFEIQRRDELAGTVESHIVA